MEREELIDKYLQSELTPTEQNQFDELLKSDPEFKNDIAPVSYTHLTLPTIYSV